jgi:Electron transfer DM13
MKNLLAFLLAAIVLMSCSKSKTAVVNEELPMGGKTVGSGSFTSGVHQTSGAAEIVEVNTQRTLVLKNFQTDAGPDLKVYLAKDLTAAEFIQLGNLKATSGNQTYAITGMPDLASYKYVLIWCQQFGVLFGSAKLQ